VISQNPIDEQGATGVDSLQKGTTNHEKLRTIDIVPVLSLSDPSSFFQVRNLSNHITVLANKAVASTSNKVYFTKQRGTTSPATRFEFVNKAVDQ